MNRSDYVNTLAKINPKKYLNVVSEKMKRFN